MGIVAGAFVLIAATSLAVWCWLRRQTTVTRPSEYGMIAPVRSAASDDGTSETAQARQSEYGAIPPARNEYDDVVDVQRVHEYDAPSSTLVT